jgi:predicted metal-dependent hydrolase
MHVDERERRLALNEALFREANERIETLADQLGAGRPL